MLIKLKCNVQLKTFPPSNEMNHLEWPLLRCPIYGPQRRAGGGVQEVKGRTDCGVCRGPWHLQICLCLGEWPPPVPEPGQTQTKPFISHRLGAAFLFGVVTGRGGGGGRRQRGSGSSTVLHSQHHPDSTSSKRAFVICHRKQPINIC